MNHKHIIPGIAVALALAGCGGAKAASGPISELSPNPPAAASSASATSASATSAQASATTNARGNLVKKVGQVAALGPISDTDPDMLMTFKVTKLDPNFTCDAEYASRPKLGHALAVTIDETTSPKATGDLKMDFGEMSWDVKIIKSDGTTENGADTMFSCAKDSETLPMDVGAGEHAKGMIVVDTGQKHGALVLSFPGMSGGWEYSF